MIKGIILAGGLGTRLYPVTKSISKQIIPIYDKPMIYYPLSILMLAGITEILIISTPNDINIFKKLLKDGSQWGIKFKYKIQPKPEGLAQAFIIGEDFIGKNPVTLILGDNIFWGHDLIKLLKNALKRTSGATIFAYQVNDPERYGVVQINTNNKIISIEEKPSKPKSNLAVTGLYCYDNNVVKYAKSLKPSKRNELEITDLNNIYLQKNKLYVEKIPRGVAWLDTGTHKSMLEASMFVETIQTRQGLLIASPEEIAYRQGYINISQFKSLLKEFTKNDYGKYLNSVLK